MAGSFNLTLDREISLEEAQQAVKELKKGKAVGIDGIMNEVFKLPGGGVFMEITS